LPGFAGEQRTLRFGTPLAPLKVRFFIQHVARYALRHKTLAVINIVSVALGVAVYLAIQIANRSATAAFKAGVDVVAGRANLEVRGTFDDDLFPSLQKVADVTAATPLVEGLVTLPSYPGEYLQILGVDPFTNSEFQNFELSKSTKESFNGAAWFGNPKSIAVTKSFADLHRLKRGDTIRIKIGEREIDLVLNFLLEAKDGDSRFAAMDIGWAQELLGLQGKLTCVLFRIRDPENPRPEEEQIRRLVPSDVEVQEPAQRSGQVEKMLAGFQLNLTALSMVSLLVGAFLIYNTVTASVVRRRSEIGILRALGASRAKVRWLFLGEATLYGAIGSLIGCVGGVLLANLLVRAVSKTVTNLYVLVSIDHFYLPIWQIPVVLLFGMCSVLAGAFIPANAGANLPPLQALNMGVLIERSEKPRLLWGLLTGATLLLALGTGQLALIGNRPAGFASAFFTLVGFCCLAPHITYQCGIGIGRIFRFMLIPRLASQNFVRSVYRHAITVAALGSALAMLISISIMIYSFRKTIDRWVDRRLVADIFIGPTANEIVGFKNFIPADLLTFLRSRSEVEMIDTYRDLTVSANGEPVSLGIVMGTKRNLPEFLGGNSPEKYEAFRRADEVTISEPLSHRLKLNQGDRVTIATPEGMHTFKVAGVFYDYSRDAGQMLMQRANFEKFWHDPRVNSVALYLQPGTNVEQTIKALRTGYPNAQDYTFYSNQALRAVVVDLFNQTFAVTQVLRVVALLVAVIGIALNLTVLVKEREREIGTMQAIGVSRRQICGLIIWESFLVGIASLLLGLATGGALSIVLTEVINKAFFGWTIPLRIPWVQILMTPIWLLPAAALASLLPANQASRGNIIDSIRMDA
jgi:putative ABC transport system permease protein